MIGWCPRAAKTLQVKQGLRFPPEDVLKIKMQVEAGPSNLISLHKQWDRILVSDIMLMLWWIPGVQVQRFENRSRLWAVLAKALRRTRHAIVLPPPISNRHETAWLRSRTFESHLIVLNYLIMVTWASSWVGRKATGGWSTTLCPKIGLYYPRLIWLLWGRKGDGKASICLLPSSGRTDTTFHPASSISPLCIAVQITMPQSTWGTIHKWHAKDVGLFEIQLSCKFWQPPL